MTRRRSFQEEFPVTAFLLLVILAFFALEFVKSPPGALLRMMPLTVLEKLGCLDPVRIRQGQYWRLLSCTFLHWNLLHLAFNGFFLFDFGRLSEPLLSRWRFLTIYTASGLGSSLTSYFLTGGLSAGASGALCGLLGALLSFSIRHEDRLLRDSLTQTVLFVVLISFMPHVDWAGHAGGFAVGFVFGWFTSPYTTSSVAAKWRYPGYVAAAAIVGSLLMALRNYFLK